MTTGEIRPCARCGEAAAGPDDERCRRCVLEEEVDAALERQKQAEAEVDRLLGWLSGEGGDRAPAPNPRNGDAEKPTGMAAAVFGDSTGGEPSGGPAPAQPSAGEDTPPDDGAGSSPASHDKTVLSFPRGRRRKKR